MCSKFMRQPEVSIIIASSYIISAYLEPKTSIHMHVGVS